jgi:hypothetical protein
MDFVESLMETLNRSWGLFAHRASAPAALMIPPIAITPDKAENNTQKEEGVRGMLPTCCLPFGDGKKRVSTEQKNLKTCVFNV